MIRNHPEAIEATQELIHDLSKAIPHVAFDHTTRVLYSTDASIYQMMPVGVVFPRDANDVSAAVEITARHGVPILPRGGGSSLCGNAIGHAVILDLSRYMDRIVDIDQENKFVQPSPVSPWGTSTRSLRNIT